MKQKCEYHNCNKKATKVLKVTDKSGEVIILGRYCREHYEKVLSDFIEIFKKQKKKVVL